MVRNLVLTAVANEDLRSQEQFYFQFWLRPIEERVTSSVTDFIYQFVQKHDFKHESKTQTFSTQYLKDKPYAKTNILAYARFYSFYEWRIMQENDTTDQSNVDKELILRVTKEILTEMANELSQTDQDDSSGFKKPADPTI